jgi:hypothetical protein
MGENLPGIMKPSTWSVWKIFFYDILEWEIEGISTVGNIAGRPYFNMSLALSVASKIYGKKRALKLLEPAFGKMPDATMPLVNISYRDIFGIILGEIWWQRTVKKLTKEIPEFIRTNPEKCKALVEEIIGAESLAQLHVLWVDKVKPLFIHNALMLKTINEHYQGPWINLAGDLRARVLGVS